MQVIAEKNNREIISIILINVLWIAAVASGVYFETQIKGFGVYFLLMGALLFVFGLPYTIYFCCMPKVILSINSNHELILPRNKVVPLVSVEKIQVKVYGRRMIELFQPSGLLIIKTASKTYRYYFIKNPDDVQERVTTLLYAYRNSIPQYRDFESLV